MTNFFRFQYGHYSLEEMQAHISDDGGDDGGTDGICACDSVNGLIRNTVFTNKDGYEAEIVILKGSVLEEIYDGVRIYPTEVLARFSPSEFYANQDEIADRYEEWQ